MGVDKSPEIATDDKSVQNPLVQHLQVRNRLPGFRVADAVGQRYLLAGVWLGRIEGEFQTVGTVWLADQHRLLRLPAPQEANDQAEIECGMRNPECGIQNAECGIQNAESRMRSAECGMRKKVEVHG